MASAPPLKACVFDAYGTLFDVHSAVARHRPRLGEAADRVSALWRTKQLEYSWLRSLMGRHADFWQVTGDALDYALEAAGITDNSVRDDLMNAYLRLDCYPEVPQVLGRLRERGIATAILSNGTPAMLAAAVAEAGIGGLLDAVLSVEEVGVYKTDPRVYQLAVDRLEAQPQAICFQSSNGWDVAGAVSFGFRVVWINRFGQPRERLPFPPEAVLKSLDGLPGLLEKSAS
ncbi:MAG: haloacid dehalogenase type II [Pseudomonadota bacterium]|nr:haloacid dehalogenase type II [Pseudomonadota bacterium]